MLAKIFSSSEVYVHGSLHGNSGSVWALSSLFRKYYFEVYVGTPYKEGNPYVMRTCTNKKQNLK